MTIRSIEIFPHSVASSIATDLINHYFVESKSGPVKHTELREFIHMLLEAKQCKQHFSYQAPGNE